MEKTNQKEYDKDYAELVGQCVRGQISVMEFEDKRLALEKKYHIFDMMPQVKYV